MKETVLMKTDKLRAWGRYLTFSTKNKMKELLKDESGMGTVEIILIIVEKPNAKHRYVLCGN